MKALLSISVFKNEITINRDFVSIPMLNNALRWIYIKYIMELLWLSSVPSFIGRKENSRANPHIDGWVIIIIFSWADLSIRRALKYWTKDKFEAHYGRNGRLFKDYSVSVCQHASSGWIHVHCNVRPWHTLFKQTAIVHVDASEKGNWML